MPIGSVGIVKYVSQYYSEKNNIGVSSILKLFFVVNLPIVTIIFLILILFGDIISSVILDNNSFNKLIIIFSFSLPIGLLASFVEIYFKAIRSIDIFVKYSVVNIALSLIISFTSIILWGLYGAALTFLISAISSVIIGIIYLKKNGLLITLKNKIQINNDVIISVLKIGLAGSVMLASQQLSYLFIKSTLAGLLSLEDVGIYQSVFSISNNYFGLFFGIIGVYSIPKISTFKSDLDTITEINNTLKLVLLIYVPVICISFIFRKYLILILYSESFIKAIDLFKYQFLGDFFKALSWIFGLWLIPYLKIKAWLFFDLLTTILFIIIFTILIYYNKFGLMAPVISYMISFIIIAIVQYMFIKKSLSFKLMNNNLRILLVSLAIIIIIFGVSSFNLIAGYFIILPVLIIWGLFSIKSSEFTKVLNYVKKYKFK